MLKTRCEIASLWLISETKWRSFGEAYFDPKGNRPLFYFRLLLLCGQFEKAVGFLFSRSAHQVDAIHFAVVLVAYYGLFARSFASCIIASRVLARRVGWSRWQHCFDRLCQARAAIRSHVLSSRREGMRSIFVHHLLAR